MTCPTVCTDVDGCCWVCSLSQDRNSANRAGEIDSAGSLGSHPVQMWWKVRMTQPPPLASASVTAFWRSARVQVASTSSSAARLYLFAGGIDSALGQSEHPNRDAMSPRLRALL
jgi:hypothetical protein